MRIALVCVFYLTLTGYAVAQIGPGVVAATAPTTAPGSSGPGAIAKPLTNSVGMTLVPIPPGEFNMGSPPSEEGHNSDEGQHLVKLTKGFYMATTPVTQAQWQTVMGTTIGQQKDKVNPQLHLVGDGAAYPMYYISWDEASDFCKKLSAKENKRYRLPTEAEWEYACRAGTSGPFGGTGNLGDMGWYDGNSEHTTHPVAQKQANACGLYDMHGNVRQWCSDRYGDYQAGEATNPVGAANGATRVLRGGWWSGGPRNCRSASRDWDAPGIRSDVLGFRIVLDSSEFKDIGVFPAFTKAPPAKPKVWKVQLWKDTLYNDRPFMMYPNNTCLWPEDGRIKGTWNKDGNNITIKWDNDTVEKVTLSDDGHTMTGTTNGRDVINVFVEEKEERVEPEAKEPAKPDGSDLDDGENKNAR